MDTQSKIIVSAVAGLVIGYFVGREHLKYQIASAFSETAGALASGLAKNFGAVPEVDAKAAPVAAEHIDTSKANASSYAGQLSLYDVQAKYITTFEGRLPGVTFKIKNTGEKAITRLKVVVYFQDATGATIAEDDFLPVYAGSFASNGSSALKPGYVWQQERNKFFTAKQVPSEWKEGAAKATITEVDFQ